MVHIHKMRGNIINIDGLCRLATQCTGCEGLLVVHGAVCCLQSTYESLRKQGAFEEVRFILKRVKAHAKVGAVIVEPGDESKHARCACCG